MWCGEHIFNPLLHHKPLQKLAGESYQFDLNLWTPNISFLKDREPNSIEARPFRAGLEISLLKKKKQINPKRRTPNYYDNNSTTDCLGCF